VITHALNLIHFEKLQGGLTDEVLDRAFDSCFLSEEEETAPRMETVMVQVPPQLQQLRTCHDHWSAILARVSTTLGCVYALASYRDRARGGYRDPVSEAEFGEAETGRTLAIMHSRAFHTWLQLTPDQKRIDFHHFLMSPEGKAAALSIDRTEALQALAPEGVKPEELQMFHQHLLTVLTPPAPLPETREVSVSWTS